MFELARVFMRRGEFERADSQLLATIELAREVGDEGILARARLGYNSLRIRVDPAVTVDDELAQALEILASLEGSDELAALVTAYTEVGIVQVPARPCRRGRGRSRASRRDRARIGDTALLREEMGARLRPAGGVRCRAADGVALCEGLLSADYANAALRAQALQILALLRAMLGDVEAISSRRRGRVGVCSRSSTSRSPEGLYAGDVGVGELIGRDLDRAEYELRRGHDVLVAMGDVGVRSTVDAILADASVPPGSPRRSARARRREPRDRGDRRSRRTAPMAGGAGARPVLPGRARRGAGAARRGGRARRTDRLPRAEGVRPRRARRGARTRRPHRRRSARASSVRSRSTSRRATSCRPRARASVLDELRASDPRRLRAWPPARAVGARTPTTRGSAARAGRRSPSAEPSREQRKVVTILFCDLVGSTALGESTDPEALRARMRRYFEDLRVILERHGGTVEKFVGDAVMAVFGIPVSHEDDALRAVRAAAEMQAAIAEHGLEARIGINTGEVVVGGEAETLVTGDAVNVAARLEQAAASGRDAHRSRDASARARRRSGRARRAARR